MDMFEERDICIVYSKEIEAAKYLSQEINEFKKNNEGYDVKASILTDKEYTDNQKTLTSDNYVIYVGTSNKIDQCTAYMTMVYNENGMVIKRIANEYQLTVDTSNLKDTENEFFNKYAPKYNIKDYRVFVPAGKNELRNAFVAMGEKMDHAKKRREQLLGKKYQYLIKYFIETYFKDYIN